MDSTTIITFLACICVLFILGKIFTVPVKFLFKIIFNSIIGGLLILLINLVGSSFNFHIGLNLFTAIFVGILGIPRCYCVGFNTSVCTVTSNTYLVHSIPHPYKFSFLMRTETQLFLLTNLVFFLYFPLPLLL